MIEQKDEGNLYRNQNLKGTSNRSEVRGIRLRSEIENGRIKKE